MLLIYQWLTTNDVSQLAVGEGQYTLLCQADGGVVDDLILYRLKEDSYLLCVNASNINKDYQWIAFENKKFNASLHNASDSWSQMAVQGPASCDVVASLV